MTPDLLIIITISSIYSAVVLTFALALIFYRMPHVTGKPFVSVLIPARNESKNIGACLEAVSKQNYPQDKYEVIVIDDRSTDGTAETARAFESRIPSLKVITVRQTPSGIAPKKHALNVGIGESRGEIILCTDADCRPKPEWIETMASGFDEQTGMVIGYSPIAPSCALSFFQHFTAIDGLALASLACATTAFGQTATATGRSLAYRKKTFEDVGGFSKIASFISGDDDLLMHRVKHTTWKIAYCYQTDAQVETGPPESFRQLFHQKIRHASKSRHYSVKMILPLILVWCFNAALAFYVPLRIIGEPAVWMTAVFPWILKFLADGLFLIAGAVKFRRLSLLIYYPLVAMIHPFYISVFGLLGLFKKFKWKDNLYSTTAEKNES